MRPRVIGAASELAGHAAGGVSTAARGVRNICGPAPVEVEEFCQAGGRYAQDLCCRDILTRRPDRHPKRSQSELSRARGRSRGVVIRASFLRAGTEGGGDIGLPELRPSELEAIWSGRGEGGAVRSGSRILQ